MTKTRFILSHRMIFVVSGADRTQLLDRILTCKLEGLKSGDARYGALLTPQGKVISDLFVYQSGDEMFLDLPSSVAETVIKRLTLLKLRADVAFTPRADLVSGVTADEAPTTALLVTTDPRKPDQLKRFLIARDETGDDETDTAYHTLRISLGLPEQMFDFADSEVFPADINMDLLNAIDFKKGCFVGQEVVSRMKRKTEVRKRTVIVSTDGNALQSGDDITAGETTIGQITSSAGQQALALLRLDRLSRAEEAGEAPMSGGQPISVSLEELTT